VLRAAEVQATVDPTSLATSTDTSNATQALIMPYIVILLACARTRHSCSRYHCDLTLAAPVLLASPMGVPPYPPPSSGQLCTLGCQPVLCIMVQANRIGPPPLDKASTRRGPSHQ